MTCRRVPPMAPGGALPKCWKTSPSSPPGGLDRTGARGPQWTAPTPDAISRDMTDLTVTILAETSRDAQAIERLTARTFGPGRYVLSAYRLREHVDHLLELSFTA